MGAGGALLAAAFVVSSLAPRWTWEKDRDVEICVDGRELEAAAGAGSAAALGRLREAGVSSVSVYWTESGASPAVPAGSRIVLRPENVPFSRAALPPASAAAHVLPAGPAVLGFPDVAPLAEWISRTDAAIPRVEFTRQLGIDALAGRFPRRLVRAHSLDEEEMARLTPAKLTARFTRAVRERGVRFLYVRFFPGLSLEKNLAFIESLAGELRRRGYRPAPVRPRYAVWGRVWPLPSGARQAAAFLAACLLPVLALRRFKANGPLSGPLSLTAANVAAALLVAAFLSTPDFALGLQKFRGVKAALLVPLALAGLSLYPGAELRRLWDRPLTVGLAAAAVAAAGVLGLYVLRSGHGSFADAGGWELRFRESLEAFFGVRPRFKEFAVGHPLLWLGFWLRTVRQAGATASADGRGEGLLDGRLFILGGMIGQLSIVNTFCHPHMPLDLSLLRVFHGAWLGALGGAALILAAKTALRLRPVR